ncbi:hypothetical protein [Pandoraea sp. ISTKB]|uniref:hypothetical protein n=1 Tax=Pandoraea sp. ISTKB TaxID=1586708 RepID=UPI0008465E59|nr:hypothetical protein [Pandoraea sp. ISTKB]ODP34982.1 hypothetical protein A9762_11470 [Pandoraea sp. ISTKB]ODP35146.1 hypothetical protein A9762_12385 [Pandoraea sp. ISTKB]
MTALLILSEALGLGVDEQRFVAAILRERREAKPYALTTVSMAALASVIESDLEPEERLAPNVQQMLMNGAEVVLAGLLRQSRSLKIAGESAIATFRVLDEVRYRKGASVVDVRIGQAFLQVLTRVANDGRVPLH